MDSLTSIGYRHIRGRLSVRGHRDTFGAIVSVSCLLLMMIVPGVDDIQLYHKLAYNLLNTNNLVTDR